MAKLGWNVSNMKKLLTTLFICMISVTAFAGAKIFKFNDRPLFFGEDVFIIGAEAVTSPPSSSSSIAGTITYTGGQTGTINTIAVNRMMPQSS